MSEEYDNNDEFDYPTYDIDSLIEEYENYEQQSKNTQNNTTITTTSTISTSTPASTFTFTNSGTQVGVEDICQICHNPEVHIYKLFKDVYNVQICYHCAKQDSNYRLVTKTYIKDEFLLSESDIQHSLRHIEKKNEKYGGWAPIKLFLYSQARDLALSIHGSFENIEEKKKERHVQRIELRVKKLQREREDELILESAHNLPMVLARRYQEKKATQAKQRKLRQDQKKLEKLLEKQASMDTSSDLIKTESTIESTLDSDITSSNHEITDLTSSTFDSDSDDSFLTSLANEDYIDVTGDLQIPTTSQKTENTKKVATKRTRKTDNAFDVGVDDIPSTLRPPAKKAKKTAKKTKHAVDILRENISKKKLETQSHIHNYRPLEDNSNIEECTICGARMVYESI